MSNTYSSRSVQIMIDNRSVSVPDGTTILDAALKLGIDVPVLCYQQDKTPAGVCRICIVQLEQHKSRGGHDIDIYKGKPCPPACIRKLYTPMDDALVVHTNSPSVQNVRKTLLELLMADHPRPCKFESCELEELARRHGVAELPFSPMKFQGAVDDSSHFIHVDRHACILCGLCIRACTDRQYFVIAPEGKGYKTNIAFDLGTPLGSSTCVSCGACVLSCPTGALTNKIYLDQQPQTPVGVPVSQQELLGVDVFRHVLPKFLQLYPYSVVKHWLKPGDVLFVEGEPGSTAFYILEGQVQVSIEPRTSPGWGIDKESPVSVLRSWLAKIRHWQSDGLDSDHQDFNQFEMDSILGLMNSQSAQLGPGDLLGANDAINSVLRRTTARATAECVVLELQRGALGILLASPLFRQRQMERYLEHGLEADLRSNSLFSPLTPEFLQHLRTKVKLLRFAPGEVIYRQGDLADALYLVRAGMVKLLVKLRGQDIVVAYYNEGRQFGGDDILQRKNRLRTAIALNHVELLRIELEDFREMLSQFPSIRVRFETAQEQEVAFSERQDVALAIFNGRLRVVIANSDTNYRVIDNSRNSYNILHLFDSETHPQKNAMKKLEDLLSRPVTEEAEFYTFFQEFPRLTFDDRYRKDGLRIVFTPEYGKSSIPDFALEPIDQLFTSDPKSSPTLTPELPSKPRFSAAFEYAISQLESYGRLLADKKNQALIYDKGRVGDLTPRALFVICRVDYSYSLDTHFEAAETDHRARTYDEVIDRLKLKIEKVKR